MRKYFNLPLLLVVVLALGLFAPLAFAQITGSVKGVCKDDDGKPIGGAEVEWLSTDTGHKYTLKTNNKGEYFSLGINPGRYNVTLFKDGRGRNDAGFRLEERTLRRSRTGNDRRTSREGERGECQGRKRKKDGGHAQRKN
jgi:hypothetical protein